MRLRFVFSVAVSLVLGVPMVDAQNFSCGIGDRGACLGYGDTVCSSSGKCVSGDAQCFDRYQCDYEGFTCKSNVTECFEKHDVLVRKFNNLLSDNEELVRSYNDLLERNNELVSKHNALVVRNTELVDKYNALLDDYDTLLAKAKNLAASYDGLNDCLSYAIDMDDVQVCIDGQ